MDIGFAVALLGRYKGILSRYPFHSSIDHLMVHLTTLYIYTCRNPETYV